jgi:hypothetical protein
MQAQHEAGLHRARVEEAKASLARTAKHSFFWSLGGLLACCLFIPSTVGVVLSLRARKMASKYRLVLPLHATLGLALGSIGILAGAGLVTIAVVGEMRRSERVEAITKLLGDTAEQSELTHASACLLAELRLLRGGFRDNDNVDGFECDGQLKRTEHSAELLGIRFEQSSEPFVATACLERGQRWAVVGFRLKARCSDPDDTAEPSGSSGPGTKDTRPPTVPTGR